MNNTEEIKRLIEAYFSGHTTLEQEEYLRQFFASANVPDELEQYRAIFSYFRQERNDAVNDGFADIEIALVQPSKRRYIMRYAITGVAAVAVIMLALLLPGKKNPSASLCQGTFVIINGECTDDPAVVARVAAESLDAIMLPVNEVQSGINSLLDENTDLIDKHIQMLEQNKTNRIN